MADKGEAREKKQRRSGGQTSRCADPSHSMIIRLRLGKGGDEERKEEQRREG
jgi:hypothetical protein